MGRGYRGYAIEMKKKKKRESLDATYKIIKVKEKLTYYSYSNK